MEVGGVIFARMGERKLSTNEDQLSFSLSRNE
jgi:hypothetical protein